MGDELGPWDPISPRDVAMLFGGLSTPWWIAGGYAIELFVGRTLRPHGDIDVLLLRRDQQEIHRMLKGWDIQAADPPGSLRPWPADQWLPDHVHDIWCRERSDGPWRLQVMLDEVDGDEWRSRRDPRIHRPVSSLGRVTGQGVPFLAPEVQLFYKAKRALPKDEIDCAAALPLLDPAARRWFDAALGFTTPGHPWRDRIAELDR